MREWQVGDPIGEGNDAGVPDIPYMGYLNNGNYDDDVDYVHSEGGDYYYPSKSYGDEEKKEKKPKGPSFNDYMNRARELSEKECYYKAVEYYDLALDKKPYHHEALLEKAECLEKIGKYEEASQCYYDLGFSGALSSQDDKLKEAVKYLKKAVELNPNYNKALTSLGHALSRLKRYDEALTYYGRVETEDELESVDWHMSRCYMNLGQYQDAIDSLDKCLARSPERGDWLCQKCECLVKLNRKDEAISEYESYIDDLISKDCYYIAIDKLDEFSKVIPDDDYFKNKKEECMEKNGILRKKFLAVFDAIDSYKKLNGNDLSESR